VRRAYLRSVETPRIIYTARSCPWGPLLGHQRLRGLGRLGLLIEAEVWSSLRYKTERDEVKGGREGRDMEIA
jgi:hypothetical protein